MQCPVYLMEWVVYEIQEWCELAKDNPFCRTVSFEHDSNFFPLQKQKSTCQWVRSKTNVNKYSIATSFTYQTYQLDVTKGKSSTYQSLYFCARLKIIEFYSVQNTWGFKSLNCSFKPILSTSIGYKIHSKRSWTSRTLGFIVWTRGIIQTSLTETVCALRDLQI